MMQGRDQRTLQYHPDGKVQREMSLSANGSHEWPTNEHLTFSPFLIRVLIFHPIPPHNQRKYAVTSDLRRSHQRAGGSEVGFVIRESLGSGKIIRTRIGRRLYIGKPLASKSGLVLQSVYAPMPIYYYYVRCSGAMTQILTRGFIRLGGITQTFCTCIVAHRRGWGWFPVLFL
ncbi:hypothetical protein K458DRAFT_125054 [Lentithecium fluviatile CBS 122367]|uniref:Uncharacterized protein n=1 Tax=Lentithecium fluviatile CBS 122367 TaxID=1168545 RepID=A0A6G1JG55_9PLEO|nr:hypothetical protein K458DRAFT_125054 [Lentithecium fluviatile CBS 122367]